MEKAAAATLDGSRDTEAAAAAAWEKEEGGKKEGRKGEGTGLALFPLLPENERGCSSVQAEAGRSGGLDRQRRPEKEREKGKGGEGNCLKTELQSERSSPSSPSIPVGRSLAFRGEAKNHGIKSVFGAESGLFTASCKYGISARRQIRIASGKVDVANSLESEWVGVNCEIDREVCRRKQGERTALNKGHSSYYVQGIAKY